MKAKDKNEVTHRKGKNQSKDTYKRCVNLKMLYGKSTVDQRTKRYNDLANHKAKFPEINDKTHTNDLETKEIMREIQQKMNCSK